MLLLVLLFPLAAVPSAESAGDPVIFTRAHFPDRTWIPLGVADGAMVGAGRFTDPASSWSGNPALVALEPVAALRLTGIAVDPRRGDIGANSIRFSEDSPRVSFGENGVVFPVGPVKLGLYAAQSSYQSEETAFVDTTAGQAPAPRVNDLLSARQRGSLLGAYRNGPIRVGAALELHRIVEEYSSRTTSEFLPDTAVVNLDGTTFGGAFGAQVAALPWLNLGGSLRFSGATDLEDEDGVAVGEEGGSFEAGFGAHVGRGTGGNLQLSALFQGEREVALGDSVGRGEERAGERWQLAAAYAYRPAQAPYEFRVGLGWSPRPADGGARMTRFGAGFGYDLDGVLVRGSFVSEARDEADGDRSRRSIFLLGLDLDI